MNTITMADSSFQQLNDYLREYPNSTPTIELHGFLTGVAVAGEYLESLPWRQKLLGLAESVKHSVIPEKLNKLIDTVLFNIEDQLSEGYFAPLASTETLGNTGMDKMHEWAKGFLDTVRMIEEDWEFFTSRNVFLGRQLLAMNMIADLEKFAPLFFGNKVDTSDPKFIQSIRDMAGPIAISMYNILGMIDSISGNEQIEARLTEMNEFLDEQRLKTLSDVELMRLIETRGDVLPVQVLNEFEDRGTAMLPLLSGYVAKHDNWYADDKNRRWGVVHAIFMLGKINDSRAATVLLDALKRHEDDYVSEIWDSVAGYWPVLFGAKLRYVFNDMRQLVQAPNTDAYVTYNVLQCLLYHINQKGEKALVEVLDLVASIVKSQPAGAESKYLLCSILLDFPRSKFKALLQQTAAEQQSLPGVTCYFDADSIESSFISGDQPEWEQFVNPWSFYDVHEIMRRQLQRVEDYPAGSEYDEYDLSGWDGDEPLVETYERDSPKVGRNDPCPCGSGKKYKKCCLH